MMGCTRTICSRAPPFLPHTCPTVKAALGVMSGLRAAGRLCARRGPSIRLGPNHECSVWVVASPRAGSHFRPIRAEANRSKQRVLHASATNVVFRRRGSHPRSASHLVERNRIRSSVLRAARLGCALGSAPRNNGWRSFTVLVATRSLLADALIMGFIAGVVVRRTPAKRMFAASELFRQSIKKGYIIH